MKAVGSEIKCLAMLAGPPTDLFSIYLLTEKYPGKTYSEWYLARSKYLNKNTSKIPNKFLSFHISSFTLTG